MGIFSKQTPIDENKMWIVYLSTYPPRQCGIATFTADLINYGDDLFFKKAVNRVVSVNTSETTGLKYPKNVIFQINENSKKEFISAAEKLNSMQEVKIISIQHEFGIFGPNYGENLIYFLEKLSKPVAVTFHTVLAEPERKMKEVMEKIIIHSSLLIVMTELSKKFLIEVYGASPEKIRVIPHGIHPQLYEDTMQAKNNLNLNDNLILTTFGLLSRGKGIEYGIQALPKIIEKYPNILYLVVGQTHPVVLKQEGEVYRNKLVKLASSLGVEKNVLFVNKYLSNEDLLLYLQATDIYLSLSQDPNQTVSGTLTYALGAGRPVISTAFMQAKEIINPHVGVLIDFNNSQMITKEVLKLLEDKDRALSLGKAAYFSTRHMTWPNVSLYYMSSFSGLLPNFSEKHKYMLPIKIDHLKKLTDNFGVFQFAALHKPDPKWGYTLDDNARALTVLSWYHRLENKKEITDLAKIYLNFIENASKPEGGFINNFDSGRRPMSELNENQNPEDSNARAFLALSVAINSNFPDDIKDKAKKILKKENEFHKKVNSPRAAALYIKSFAENFPRIENSNENIIYYADFLVDLYERSSDEKWNWFESITYSNALLSEAMLVAYRVTNNLKYLEVGKRSLDFLISHSFEGDVCVPVGQAGWFKKGNKKEVYDQQPEEVSALVRALKQMVLIDDNPEYLHKMMLAFDWFFGNNLSHQVVYTHFTGGSYDGIRKDGVNLNQGSESTISYLLARISMELNENSDSS